MASSSHMHSSMSVATEITPENERAFVVDEGSPSEVDAQPSDPPPKYFEENGLRFRIPSHGRSDYTHRRMYDLSVTPPQYGFFFLDPIRRNCYGEPDPNQSPVRSKEEVQQRREEVRQKREVKRKRGEGSGERIYIPDMEPDDKGLVMGLPYSYGYLIDPPPTFDIHTTLRKRRPQQPPSDPELAPEPDYESILFERPSDDEEDHRLKDERIEKLTIGQFSRDDWQSINDVAMNHQYIQDNWHLSIDEETYSKCYSPFCKEDFEKESLLDDNEPKEEEKGLTKEIKKRRLNDGQPMASKVLSVAWGISKRILKLLTSRISS